MGILNNEIWVEKFLHQVFLPTKFKFGTRKLRFSADPVISTISTLIFQRKSNNTKINFGII